MAEKSLWVYIKEFLFSREKQPDERELMIKYKALAFSWKISVLSLAPLMASYCSTHDDIPFHLLVFELIIILTVFFALMYYRRKL